MDCEVLIVGAGIHGAAVAQAAAAAGYRTLLLEQYAQPAQGTSSKSSKLIHGGLRYLAMGDIALVRETALERKEIHRLAPHLAEPRWVVVPARSRAGLLKMRAGITTYEKLGAVEDAARAARCRRLWLVTTNDNLHALRFYQKRRFRIRAVHPDALDGSRRLKPEIPLIGIDGLPLRDEIELDLLL